MPKDDTQLFADLGAAIACLPAPLLLQIIKLIAEDTKRRLPPSD